VHRRATRDDFADGLTHDITKRANKCFTLEMIKYRLVGFGIRAHDAGDCAAMRRGDVSYVLRIEVFVTLQKLKGRFL
jgi:TolB-like protein